MLKVRSLPENSERSPQSPGRMLTAPARSRAGAYTRRPEVMGRSFMMALMRVVRPEPTTPAMPRISPSWRVNETSLMMPLDMWLAVRSGCPGVLGSFGYEKFFLKVRTRLTKASSPSSARE